ncbi:MAG: type II toxin-antitoxin system Phd/YefM family antitoxin [Oscillospiraceae bacterium]|nr:type II toxin-antitoxin system Phd/YefM family antitoxin [Oscillospiraceae bacterium]
MINTNATNFRRNIYGMLEQTIKYNEPVNVSTKDGNAVVMSEEEYNSIMETLYLSSMPATRQEIVEGLQTDVEDCLGEDRVQW